MRTKTLYSAVRHYCIVLTLWNKANFEVKESKKELKVCDTARAPGDKLLTT